jgi:uncharacterized membrane protein YccC
MITSLRHVMRFLSDASRTGKLSLSWRDFSLSAIGDAASSNSAVASAVPILLFGLRLWGAVCLALFIAFYLELDNAYWAGASAAAVCQISLGASLRKGWFRMIGTIAGAVTIVALTACFPQDRFAFLSGLALWGAACAFLATLLRNFASYAAALAGITAAVIAGGQLGSTGGPSGDAFTLAVTRVSEICIGIVCAGIVQAGADFCGSRRKLSHLLDALSEEIFGFLSTILKSAGSEFADAQIARRQLIRRVIELDPVIDAAIGESPDLHYRSSTLKAAVDGLFVAMSGLRIAAGLLARMPCESARLESKKVVERIPVEALGRSGAKRWLDEPLHLRRTFAAAGFELIAFPADTPSLRLLADKTGQALIGLSQSLDGLALLIGRARSNRRGGGPSCLHVPDWLPPFVNATRALATIGMVELFWIVTKWPNGATAITFATIGVILFAQRADRAFAATISFMGGAALAIASAAIVEFSILPGLQTFPEFCLAIGLVLIPAGSCMAQARQPDVFMSVTALFIPFLAPTNQMSYDTLQFYNNALAIVGGLGAAALSFRVMPPLSPVLRSRRLLALTLSDLRRLAIRPTRRTSRDWAGRSYSRLSVLPEDATPLQRSQLLATTVVGCEIIQLRLVAHRLGLDVELDAPLRSVAGGEVILAITQFAKLDSSFAALGTRPFLRARARILAITQVLDQHASYFARGSEE